MLLQYLKTGRSIVIGNPAVPGQSITVTFCKSEGNQAKLGFTVNGGEADISRWELWQRLHSPDVVRGFAEKHKFLKIANPVVE